MPTAKERATVDAKPTFDKDGNKAKVKGGGIADRAREYSRIIRAISGYNDAARGGVWIW